MNLTMLLFLFSSYYSQQRISRERGDSHYFKTDVSASTLSIPLGRFYFIKLSIFSGLHIVSVLNNHMMFCGIALY